MTTMPVATPVRGGTGDENLPGVSEVGARVRLALIADEVGVPFPTLFSAFCRVMPDAVGDDLCVSSVCAAVVVAAGPALFSDGSVGMLAV